MSKENTVVIASSVDMIVNNRHSLIELNINLPLYPPRLSDMYPPMMTPVNGADTIMIEYNIIAMYFSIIIMLIR